MNIHVYTRQGSHYNAYDDIDQWELIKTYTNFTYGEEFDEDPARISFPPQFTVCHCVTSSFLANLKPHGFFIQSTVSRGAKGIGQTRAFYIAIVETYGETEPMANGVAMGENYLGVWAEDDNVAMMEGIKFFGISADRPVGNGQGTYDVEDGIPHSGVYQHEGPGGKSYNLQVSAWHEEIFILIFSLD